MAGILLEGERIDEDTRARHARAMAEKNRTAAIERAARLRQRVGDVKLRTAAQVAGSVIEDIVVDAGGHYGRPVAKSEHLRIIDLEGRQAVDFLCYDLHRRDNRYNAANTIKFNRSIYVGEGFRLFSELADVLMTIVQDTVGGHDTIGGCCSAEANHLRYGIQATPSCRANFIAALAAHGMDARDIVTNLNFFMSVPVGEDGSAEIVEGRSEPGDYVDLIAERDVLVAISNCPQIYNPCNGWNPTPIRLIRWR